MTDIKEAHEKARDFVKSILESEFFRENFYNIRESEADAMAERLLKTAYASLEASGFVVVPVEATERMCRAARGAGIFDPRVSSFTYKDMLNARPRLTDDGDA